MLFLPALSPTAKTFPCTPNTTRREKRRLCNCEHILLAECIPQSVNSMLHALKAQYILYRMVTLGFPVTPACNCPVINALATRLLAFASPSRPREARSGFVTPACRQARRRLANSFILAADPFIKPQPSPAAPENTPSNSPAAPPLATLAAAKPRRPRPTFSQYTGE